MDLGCRKAQSRMEHATRVTGITHPEQRVVYTDNTIGVLNVELSVSYCQFLHVLLWFFSREETECAPVDTLRLGLEGWHYKYTNSLCRVSDVNSTALGGVEAYGFWAYLL